MSRERILTILEKHEGKQGALISILEEIQSEFSYLPESALRVVADTTGRSLVEVMGVATFYRSFSLKPRGRHLMSVCLGTACHVRRAPKIADEVSRQLGIKAGETTEDQEFTFETVNCLGACALGPVVVVDGHYFPHVTPPKVSRIIEKTREGLDRIDLATDRRVFPLEVRRPHCNHSLMDADRKLDGHPAVHITVSFGRKHGWIRLSSLYGSYTMASEHEIPLDTVVHCYCPHCHAELGAASTCAACGASMVPLIVRGGGIVQICSRRGCKAHMLDVS